ncbi:hypothetical protein F8388_010140 [Cannabis sativa]|uniref:Serine aminopeptidase S33 domain-containing protein n=1 Tax=Cannabis sativa TaxID=3483 RepID=A0A7J6GRL4_CANSA|nr:hypothetical protein F8388_010140 [Cannabis sativa]
MSFNWVCSVPSQTFMSVIISNKCKSFKGLMNNGIGGCNGFPSFLPKEASLIKDPYARALARRIQRLPVQLEFEDSRSCIMSSCVKPLKENEANPVVLLHCFDSSCLEWRCALPLLENAGLETWAIDIWNTYIKRPMILVGPSLGASVAIDFALHYPEAVKKLVLINASVYAEGNGILSKLPNTIAYAGASLLKCLPLRLYANMIAFSNISLSTTLDWTNDRNIVTMEIRLTSYGVKQKTLVICGEQDQIISYKETLRLHCELPNSNMRLIPESGHLPHVEKPASVAELIREFVQGDI